MLNHGDEISLGVPGNTLDGDDYRERSLLCVHLNPTNQPM